MAKTEIDSKAAEAANEEQVKETETQAEAEAVKEKEASSEDAQAPEGEKEKKGFFSKKKDKKDEQIEELTDRLKRTMAEFDNFRKRTEKEKSAMYEIGAKDIIEKILPESSRRFSRWWTISSVVWRPSRRAKKKVLSPRAWIRFTSSS